MLPTEKTKPKLEGMHEPIMLYGTNKIGKSTFCAQAPNALFLATEPGLDHLESYQHPILLWEDIQNVCKLLKEQTHSFSPIVIDTIDNAYMFCSTYICQKLNIKHPADLPMGKGWGMLNNELYRVLNKLALLGHGLIMVSHSQIQEIKTKNGSVYNQITPMLPPKARKLLCGLANYILYCDMESIENEKGETQTRRVLRTKPTAQYVAGDRSGNLPETLPLDYDIFMAAREEAILKKAKQNGNGFQTEPKTKTEPTAKPGPRSLKPQNMKETV